LDRFSAVHSYSASYPHQGEATEPRNHKATPFEKEGHMSKADSRFFIKPLMFAKAYV
jgi:hypothetical protein